MRLPDGRLETFRLYFVDTTESRSHSTRSDEQAAYFGISREAAVELGKQAKAFTARALSRLVITADGTDLAELLVRNGLARIYGTRTPLPGGRDSGSYRKRLIELERLAKQERTGGWG